MLLWGFFQRKSNLKLSPESATTDCMDYRGLLQGNGWESQDSGDSITGLLQLSGRSLLLLSDN